VGRVLVLRQVEPEDGARTTGYFRSQEEAKSVDHCQGTEEVAVDGRGVEQVVVLLLLRC